MALKQARLYGLEINQHIYNGLIRTLASATTIGVREEHVEEWIQDAWNLFHKVQEEGYQVNVQLLNTMLYLHTKAVREEELETRVLPLYKKHKIQYDVYTYQHLIEFFREKQDADQVYKLYARLKAQEIQPNKSILEATCFMALKQQDADLTYVLLKDYLSIQREPTQFILSSISQIRNVPDHLYAFMK